MFSPVIIWGVFSKRHVPWRAASKRPVVDKIAQKYKKNMESNANDGHRKVAFYQNMTEVPHIIF